MWNCQKPNSISTHKFILGRNCLTFKTLQRVAKQCCVADSPDGISRLNYQNSSREFFLLPLLLLYAIRGNHKSPSSSFLKKFSGSGEKSRGRRFCFDWSVEGRAVAASSRGVRGRYSISNISSTSAPIGETVRVGSLYIHSSEDDENKREDGGHNDDGDSDGDDDETVLVAQASSSGHRPTPSKGKGLTGSFMSVKSKIAGSRQKRPEKSCPPTNRTQRKKAKNDGWEQTGPVDGGPQDPVLVPSYSGHVAGSIWRGHDRDILKSRSPYVSLTGWTPSDLVVVQLAGETGLSHLSSLFTDKGGNNVLGKLWLLVKNVRSFGVFAWDTATLAYLYRSLGQASRVDT
ncbi:hypothetical protein M9H77_35732 [Catharanthus roseus]|uniref:Uncharacterized protein n=1 Tax=Catharanthus roseus TaxID=4058 RepID=A0ACB9ZU32_CATRO|nr:hypothetical protein M9H77_35732 [Catharanthus roseus]